MTPRNTATSSRTYKQSRKGSHNFFGEKSASPLSTSQKLIDTTTPPNTNQRERKRQKKTNNPMKTPTRSSGNERPYETPPSSALVNENGIFIYIVYI